MLFSLILLQWMRNQYRELSRESKLAWRAQQVLTAIAAVDLSVSFAVPHYYNHVAALIRPFLLLTQFRVLRNHFFKIMFVLYQALPMFLLILLFVAYYSWMLQRGYSGTVEGVKYFVGPHSSFYNMLVLLTTSNYPDVMLPAYEKNPFNSLPFIVFLMMTMFFMMNFLLAIIYSKFKDRIENKLDSEKHERLQFLKEQFKLYAMPGTNFLDITGMYKYFIMIHSVVNKKHQDKTFDDD